MSVIINGGAGVTFPDAVQQTNGMTNTGGNPPYYAARAWVKFDNSGTILGGVNVASVTVNGTGDFTVTFSTQMPDANYAVVGACRRSSAGTRGTAFEVEPSTAPTAAAVRVRAIAIDTAPAPTNITEMYVAVFR